MRPGPDPGDRGYGAHWKREVRKAGFSKLRGLPEGVGGKALLAVITAFGEHIDNRSGEAWPSQRVLAEESGQGKRTVERALKAAGRLGWLVEVRAPVPGIRGRTYRATVPESHVIDKGKSSPTGEHPQGPIVADPTSTPRQSDRKSSPIAHRVVASSDEQTLTGNSHLGTLREERRPLTGAAELSGNDTGEEEQQTTYTAHDNWTDEQRARWAQVWDDIQEEAAGEAELNEGEDLGWQSGRF